MTLVLSFIFMTEGMHAMIYGRFVTFFHLHNKGNVPQLFSLILKSLVINKKRIKFDIGKAYLNAHYKEVDPIIRRANKTEDMHPIIQYTNSIFIPNELAFITSYISNLPHRSL